MITMDLNALVRMIFLEKSDLTFGIVGGLLLFSIVLMLIRSVMEEKEGVAAGATATIDPKSINVAIEGALKKAFADKTITGGVASAVNAGGTAVESVSGDANELKKVLSEREAKIAALTSDLETMKSQIEAKAGAMATAGAVPAAGGSGADAELLTKVKELQAKLSEYEIIEDDIADLSVYKEENKKLKEEVEKLRTTIETAPPPAPTAAAPVETTEVKTSTPAPVTSPAMSADASAEEFAEPAAAAMKPTPAPAFKLDASDDVMGAFAQALSGESAASEATESQVISEIASVDATNDSAPATTETTTAAATNATPSPDLVAQAMAELETRPAPLAEKTPEVDNSDPFGALDTEKMLAEVASMSDAPGDSSSVLEDQLDTDRLMAEMGMADSPTASTTIDSPAVAEIAPPPAPTAAPAFSGETPVDDLLAEFKDTDFQTSKGSKGSS